MSQKCGNAAARFRVYDQLSELNQSPVVELNRVVVVAKVNGPEAALAAFERTIDSRIALRLSVLKRR